MASDATKLRNVKQIIKNTREAEKIERNKPGRNRSTAARHGLKAVNAGFDKIEEIVSRKR